LDESVELARQRVFLIGIDRLTQASSEILGFSFRGYDEALFLSKYCPKSRKYWVVKEPARQDHHQQQQEEQQHHHTIRHLVKKASRDFYLKHNLKNVPPCHVSHQQHKRSALILGGHRQRKFR
jgi:hypothetical protein